MGGGKNRDPEMEKIAFNSHSKGTLRKLHHVKAAFDRCTTSKHVHQRRSSRRVTAVSNRVGAPTTIAFHGCELSVASQV